MNTNNRIEKEELMRVAIKAETEWNELRNLFLDEKIDDIPSKIDYIMDKVLEAGYYKLRRCTFELPCLAGDLVFFKGLEEPWKVSAIHLYSNGAPQISITSPSGKITSTMTFLEFEEFAAIINPKTGKVETSDGDSYCEDKGI